MANVKKVLKLGTLKDHDIFSYRGYLACDCGMWPRLDIDNEWDATVKPVACPHTWEAMKRRMDVTEYPNEVFDGRVVVPVLRPQPKVTASLYFRDQVGGGLAVAVEVDRDKERSGMVPYYIWMPWSDVDDHPIGFLDTHEGRWNMRDTILEWLRARYYDVPPCTSKFHTGEAFSRKERVTKHLDSTDIGLLMNVHEMVTSGTCLACSEGDGDDLIPDI